jgi:DNA-binding winged helix-turn-helix (wHTH) protein
LVDDVTAFSGHEWTLTGMPPKFLVSGSEEFLTRMAYAPTTTHRIVSFGRFAFDLTDRRLTCSGKPVTLSNRALDILCELVHARGEVVDKDRLMERVWPGRIVEENALHVHISTLRKVLEPGSHGQSFVVTVPGRGYRLVGVDSPACADATSPAAERAKTPGTSVAVLRFANLSGDPEQTMPAGAGEAIPILQRAVELEPDYAAAHAHLSRCFQMRFSRHGLNEADREASVRHARAAIRSDDATALGTAALVIWFDDPDYEVALEVFERALSISSSNVVALGNSAFVNALMGRSELAMERARQAMGLSPFDTLISNMAIAVAEFHAGRFEAARLAAVRSVEANPYFSVPRILLTVALVELGRIEEARLSAAEVLSLDPTFSMPVWSVTIRKNPAVFDPMARAWAKLSR